MRFGILTAPTRALHHLAHPPALLPSAPSSHCLRNHPGLGAHPAYCTPVPFLTAHRCVQFFSSPSFPLGMKGKRSLPLSKKHSPDTAVFVTAPLAPHWTQWPFLESTRIPFRLTSVPVRVFLTRLQPPPPRGGASQSPATVPSSLHTTDFECVLKRTH